MKGGSYNTLSVSNTDTVGKIVTLLSKKMSLTDIHSHLEVYEEVMGKGDKSEFFLVLMCREEIRVDRSDSGSERQVATQER
jgi:hypothetical protein